MNNISAILGPTNTGKTFFAIKKMLKCDNGVIGFPLRLLARENYEYTKRIVGESKVALITGFIISGFFPSFNILSLIAARSAIAGTPV